MATPFTPGPLTAAQARQLNELVRKLEALDRLSVAPPLSLTRPAGVPSIRLDSTGFGDNSAWKEPARVATTANGTLASAFEAGDTVDGVVLVGGDRILIKNQTTATENGVYIVNPSGAPTRADDANDGVELVGAVIWVSEGTANADSIWACTTNAPITLGATALTWVKVYPQVSAWKEPVRAATTVSGTLATAYENGDTIDGVTLATGDRILIKNQSTAAENGIYTVNASGAPTRGTDADAGDELVGATVWVSEGTTNADTIWSCTTNAPITINVTSLSWLKVAPGVGTITVEEVDGSPSVTSVSVVQVNQANGLRVTTPGAGTARIDIAPASATDTGVVNTTTQTFAGDKTFTGLVTANGAGFQTDTGFLLDQTDGEGTKRVAISSIDMTDAGAYSYATFMTVDSTDGTHVGSAVFTIMNRHGTPDKLYLQITGAARITAVTGFAISSAIGTAPTDGVSGSFTTADSKTVTVTGGIITAIV